MRVSGFWPTENDPGPTRGFQRPVTCHVSCVTPSEKAFGTIARGRVSALRDDLIDWKISPHSSQKGQRVSEHDLGMGSSRSRSCLGLDSRTVKRISLRILHEAASPYPDGAHSFLLLPPEGGAHSDELRNFVLHSRNLNFALLLRRFATHRTSPGLLAI